MNPRQLSHELRNEVSPHLTRRRWIIGLSMLGGVMAKIVSLYQTGMIRRLPDPPVPIFDSTRVDASTYAYKRLDTPDAFLMGIGYAMTAALAAAGGMNRHKRTPLLPIAMTAKIAADIATGVVLAREEWAENKALCFYCQVASVASIASLVVALPEMVDAVRSLGGQEESGVPIVQETLDKAEMLIEAR